MLGEMKEAAGEINSSRQFLMDLYFESYLVRKERECFVEGCYVEL